MKNTPLSDLKKIEFNVHVLYNKLNILVFTIKKKKQIGAWV